MTEATGGPGRPDRTAGDPAASEPAGTDLTTRRPTVEPRTGRGPWRGGEGPRRGVDTGTVVWGVILVTVGTWFFLDRTLGLDLPDIDWGQLWPVILIVVGAAVILQGVGRRRA